MQKHFFYIILVLALALCSNTAFAKITVKNADTQPKAEVQENLKSEHDTAEAQIKLFFEKFEKLQNSHNIIALKKLYANDYINNDGYSKEQLFDLMSKTFKSYPNINSTFTIKKIIISNTYAMVYTSQVTKAKTKTPSEITKDVGSYTANLDTIFYLRKMNEDWQIYSENVVYETSKLAFGVARDIDASIYAPQKVLSGTEYFAGIKLGEHEGYTPLASINTAALTVSDTEKEESFRQVASKDNALERMVKANTNNNNEAILASVGFTKVNEGMFKKSKVDIVGLLLLMQRVDILPNNSNNTVKDKDEK